MTNKTSAVLISLTILAVFSTNNQAICLAQSADNARINQRDGRQGELRAEEQDQTKSDLEITQRIRKAIISEKSLSRHAHNVKIDTKNGMVTLKGSVASIEERKLIEKIAAEVVRNENIQSELGIIND